ncbi:hypothetical protein DYB30_002464 [Aphanomyces astaci]|uniref:Uncharacterized protein n=1 Tax=Aphanomyces astaci TaxID=112090 RepID=A0A397FA90_APHAT|nr:hypothetical protein DYB30_002464 [Aphanomyces astaci]RHZ14788.1 hypothetical protein DYB26_006778 [Aphanomyces astaci]RHZ22661.1 hypothetical protein DYB31_008349 [Aphanomyces astaci]
MIQALHSQVAELTRHRDRLRSTKELLRNDLPKEHIEVEAALRERVTLLRQKDQLAAIIDTLQSELFPPEYWCVPPPFQAKPEPYCNNFDEPHDNWADMPPIHHAPCHIIDMNPPMLTPSFARTLPPLQHPPTTMATGHGGIHDIDFIKMEYL